MADKYRQWLKKYKTLYRSLFNGFWVIFYIHLQSPITFSNRNVFTSGKSRIEAGIPYLHFYSCKLFSDVKIAIATVGTGGLVVSLFDARKLFSTFHENPCSTWLVFILYFSSIFHLCSYEGRKMFLECSTDDFWLTIICIKFKNKGHRLFFKLVDWRDCDHRFLSRKRKKDFL